MSKYKEFFAHSLTLMQGQHILTVLSPKISIRSNLRQSGSSACCLHASLLREVKNGPLHIGDATDETFDALNLIPDQISAFVDAHEVRERMSLPSGESRFT